MFSLPICASEIGMKRSQFCEHLLLVECRTFPGERFPSTISPSGLLLAGDMARISTAVTGSGGSARRALSLCTMPRPSAVKCEIFFVRLIRRALLAAVFIG